MPTYDRGSAPIEKPKGDIPPPPKPFTAGENDAPIVQCAEALDREAEKQQADLRTEGRQAGFTSVSVDGIRQSEADSRAEGDAPGEELSTAFTPDDDGYVPDLPGEENVYPAPQGDLPPGTVVLAELSEEE